MTDIPLRFRVVGDEIVEKGGQVLASLNLDCIPSILDDFALFIDSVGDFGPTDEIEEVLYPDEEALSSTALTTYQEMRERLGESTIGGLVPLPIALLMLREALSTPGDDEDTPVVEEPETEEPWTNDNGSDEDAATSPLHGTIEHGSGDPAGGVIGDTVAGSGTSA